MSIEKGKVTNQLILIVEDDPGTRMILKDILRKEGYLNVVEASSGEEALSKLNESRFDLVICDWHMPGISGLQLFERIKESPNIETMPVLMVTGETEKSMIMKAIQAGVSGYIVKPLSPKNIVSKVESVFSPKES